MLVAAGATERTNKSLAKAAGLAVPTAHHLLSTLVAEGLLARDNNTRYILGPKVGVLAEAFHRELGVPDTLLRPLERLATTTGETTYLAGWRNGNVQILAQAEGSLAVRVSVSAAEPYHDAHARAGGKALLAFASPETRDRYLSRNPLRSLTPHTVVDAELLAAELDKIRTEGVAYDEEEFQSGVSCIAVPVLEDGSLVAVYAMSIPSQRFAQRREELSRALVSTAKSVVAGGMDGD
jgi:DNA-binding IclR family transcriptional regulator